jgi:hypothetical protein
MVLVWNVMNNLVETDTYFPTNGITITLLVHAFSLIGTEKKGAVCCGYKVS